MVTITLSEADAARTRLAYSPTWEAVASALLVVRPDKRCWSPTSRRWLAQALDALAGVDLEPLAVLIRGSTRYLPDFLMPPPDEAAPTFEAELERLRATSPQRVAVEARLTYPDETPAALVPYLERPGEALATLVDLLEDYWQRTLAPWWPQIRALLECEMIACAHRFAQGGTDALLAELSPGIHWEPPVLRVEKKHCSDVDAAGRGLLLVPTVFGGPTSFVSVDGPWRPTVSYAARGLGVLWGDADETEDEAPLELLLGRGRAAVLTALAQPASTTALALRLGVSPSTVSEHLAVLSRSGVVLRRRTGRLVLYSLTPRGEQLVALLAAGESAVRIA